MKKLLLAFIAVFLATFTFAEGHMTFKGVEIDGSIQDFANNLTAKDFKVISIEKDNAMLAGTFTGQDVLVAVYTTPNSKKVYRVAVMYQTGSTWTLIYSQYANLKDMLTQKYGEPAQVKEEFKEGHFRAGDELYALHMDKLVYQSAFGANEGVVTLTIAHEQSLGDFILVAYEDSMNAQIAQREMIDEL